MKQYTFGSDYWQTGADLIQSELRHHHQDAWATSAPARRPPDRWPTVSAPLVSESAVTHALGSDPLPIRFAIARNDRQGV